MAGRGSRFQDAGYTVPKPLIPVCGVPMIHVVLRNLKPSRTHRFIFIALRDLVELHRVDRLLTEWSPGCVVRCLDGVTEGAACTVLTVRDLIDNDAPLMIANCDQWVDIDINDYLRHQDHTGADGMIMTMWADHPKWSYVRFDDLGEPAEVVEKQVVSNEATVGIYNYRRGSEFVAAADAMIAKSLRVNGEFYVAPAYNEMLRSGKRICLYNVGREYDGMYGLGTPADLGVFEGLPVARKATAFCQAEVRPAEVRNVRD
ncbi:MAG TPA: glycosyltransferase family 2 protein [Sedimentisphaerales bacterium]|nr:glycosyltransferase family 2 protein [Sedimentisphaerales bacterium]